MNWMKASVVDGLKPGVLPVAPSADLRCRLRG